MVAAVMEREQVDEPLAPPVAVLPQQMITEYVVTPDGYNDVHLQNQDRWTVRVRRVSMCADEWAVFDSTGARVFSAVGVGWFWRKRIPAGQFTAWCVMSGKEAHRLAVRIVSTLKVDGVTFIEAKERARERAPMPCPVLTLDPKLLRAPERDFDELYFDDEEDAG